MAAVQQAQQGRLAGTGGAHEGDELAGVDLQVHPVQHRVIPEPLDDPVQGDAGGVLRGLGRGLLKRHHGRPPPGWSRRSRGSDRSRRP
ncbi:hypothetical protein ACFFX0_14325 [Citricoccus parietis]|uniref:Uncharacterized protein n=1 Tax=Citricoccus parietis TaxID=592307 RepID=A0ABV5G1D6_9MICC